MNRITHCRIDSFQSDSIKIRAQLSLRLATSLDFRIQKDLVDDPIHGQRLQLKISHTAVDLIVDHPKHRDMADKFEDDFTTAFFVSLLCSSGSASPSPIRSGKRSSIGVKEWVDQDTTGGPMSEESLANMTHPRHIKGLLRRLSGHISSLRTVLHCLREGLCSRGWRCTMSRKAQAGSPPVDYVSVCPPTREPIEMPFKAIFAVVLHRLASGGG